MDERLDILKTFKLYIGGAFPRSESGRSEPIVDMTGRVMGHSCKASRKDLRDAVAAARKAQPGWRNATAYNRGQVLYRLAEMVEGKRAEFVSLLRDGGAAIDPEAEVSLSVDRLVYYAGWTDKFAQVTGAQNPVAGPYWNITVPEPTGVIGVVCPAAAGKGGPALLGPALLGPALLGPALLGPALLGLVTLVAPLIAVGNAVVVISPAYPPVVSVFGEACATSDLPGGVVNLLTGSLDELAPVLAKHRDIDGLHAAIGDDAAALAKELRLGVAENLKRVMVRRNVAWTDAAACEGTGWIEPFVEYKTSWHPVGA